MLGHGSRHRTVTWHMQGPGFNPQYWEKITACYKSRIQDPNQVGELGVTPQIGLC
jgi:hypothetical protein